MFDAGYRMLGAGAWGRSRGMMWGGRWEWEWFMFGSSCTPVADSCQCMPKPIQYCKVKYSKIKIKKNKPEFFVFFKNSK